MGVDQQKAHKYHNRWVLSCQMLGDDAYAGFKKLEWFLQKNKLNSLSNHGLEFYSAFALIHDRRPFFIRVEIKGKLEKRWKRAQADISEA